MLAVAVAIQLGLGGATAAAAPGDDEVTAAEAAQQAAGAEVARVQEQLAAVDAELERVTLEAEAAAGVTHAAQAALLGAQQRAAVTAAELATAQAAVVETQDEVIDLGRETFMAGDASGAAALLNADGPDDLLDKAATLDILGEDRAATLEQFEVLETARADADEAARAAVAERDAAALAAAQAQAEADAQVLASQQAHDAAVAQKVLVEEQLAEAQIALLAAQGARDARRAYEEQQAAAQAAAAVTVSAGVAANARVAATGGSGVAPTAGRVTSCYGARWGTTHYGVDIAAPIGTPVYAPEGGTVLHAGSAQGFGQALYLQHANGTITLYGHVDRFYVGKGERVETGTLIAAVGNRGQSTGPHLHFEVHTGGLYATRTNPMPWLASHGVTLGGSCS